MKIFFLDKFIAWTGKKLDGYKTKLGGLGFILYGITGLLGRMFPDMGLPEMETSNIVEVIFAGLAIFGLAGKADKITEVIKINTTEKPTIVTEKPPEEYVSPGAGPIEP